MNDKDTGRRLLAFRVVSEALFRPGEEFIIISPTQESADALCAEIDRMTKAVLSDLKLPPHLVRGDGMTHE